MEKGGDMVGQAANNSSDFVRKLYKMLEDPAYDAIVRWGENGESFVVLENEKFTKFILPKHFKHSNFASFVRQLNKYDFHKVRQNNDDTSNSTSPYGPGAWEFKHPEFQANKKDSLDNIRRKAPAPRKPTTNTEDSFSAQQMDLLNSQLTATQQQLQQITERYHNLASGHSLLLDQVVQLQKFVKNHDGVMHRVMGFLHSVDAQRRNSRIGQFVGLGVGEPISNDGILDDHPASPLQRASELLDEISTESLPNKKLEQLTQDFNLRNDYATYANDNGSSMGTLSDGCTSHIRYPSGNDLDNMVYPVGQTNGIDPINSEHINNIPYALPTNGMLPVDGLPDMIDGDSSADRKKSVTESIWGINKPRILLVEDDPVCARIGSKFLQLFECGVETARDGLEAVNKISASPIQFDLILMDIIMPHLDGVSATVCIRETRPHIPVIAMTSNIRTDDIDMYFRYGMNDVLPKPFTKEGMLRALEKHLPQFRNEDHEPSFQQRQMQHEAGFVTPGASQAPIGLNMGQLSAHSLKQEDLSPGRSPATASWHSPSQLPGQSPVGNGPQSFMQPMGDNRQFIMAPSHSHPQSGYPSSQNPVMGAPRVATNRRAMADMTNGCAPDEIREKRQRIFPPFAPGSL